MIKRILCFWVLGFLLPFSGQAGNGFITTWKVTKEDLSITIPTDHYVATYMYLVDWGDGTTSEGLTENASHTYTDEGTYTVEINGVFPSIYFKRLGMKLKAAAKLYSIEQWGTIKWKSFSFAFFNCRNLVCNANDTPDLSQVTDMSFMFYGTDNFNGNINNWDVSTITDMSSMFIGADNFNSDISNWDVSNVTDMLMMFFKASSFNQPIGNWDVSSVTDMASMFEDATSFNQPIGDWDVSNVTDMSSMFSSEVPTPFHPFNQSIGNWDVSNVTNMNKMFSRATSFDQSLVDWDVSNVTDMAYMFSESSFNQPIGKWNIENVKDMNHMLEYSGMSTKNYDATLAGWARQKVQNNVMLGAYKITYCSSNEARQKLIDEYGWVIKEDMYLCD